MDAFQVPVVKVPTLVNEEAVTPEPRVVAFRTEVPLISYALPVTRLKSSEEVQPVVDQVIDLSVAPLRTIPPPLAVVGIVTGKQIGRAPRLNSSHSRASRMPSSA